MEWLPWQLEFGAEWFPNNENKTRRAAEKRDSQKETKSLLVIGPPVPANGDEPFADHS